MILSNVENWVRINAPKCVLSWIEHGVPIRFNSPPSAFELPNRPMNSKETMFIDHEIDRLLQLRYIEQCDADHKPICVNPINCVPKKKTSSSKFRLITDLRRVNLLCAKVGYKNEDIRTIAQLVEHDDLMISVDLKDSFFHVPVQYIDTQYLGFKWRNVYYKWLVTPFGLACSPYYFCKIVRPVIVYLRSFNVRVSVYVDDFLLCSKQSTITDHCDLLLDTLRDLGFTINVDKSVLTPAHMIEHIGYVIRTSLPLPSRRPVISVVPRRMQSLRHDIRRVLNHGRVTARSLARVTGSCVSMAWAVSPGKLLLRHCYRLLSDRSSWDSTLELTNDVIDELQWWLNAADTWNYYEVAPKTIDIQIYTDASHIGYGGLLVGTDHVVSGEWNRRMSVQSSNYRELFAILMVIHALKDHIKSKTVEILTTESGPRQSMILFRYMIS